MSAIIIRGGRPLSGSLTVQGAKNSVLPILAATLLSGEVCRIRHCPRLRDVETAMEILRHLGCRADWQGRDLLVDAADLTRWDVPDHLMSRMRSSVVFLGAILARCGQGKRAERYFEEWIPMEQRYHAEMFVRENCDVIMDCSD